MHKLTRFIHIAVSLTVFLPFSSSAQKEKVKKTNKPNVIIIYSDDHGSRDMNIYGARDVMTPNLDRLARNGVRFNQFYAASAICSPSRASLLTGRYPQRAGLVGNAPAGYGSSGMPGSQYTMAEMFKEGGYRTAHIGKWHIGYNPETMPNSQGFDYSWGFMGGCIDNYSHYFYWSGPNVHDLWRNGKEIWEPGKFFPDRMVEEAGDFMAKNSKQPFFMYWAINGPHYPVQPDIKWMEYYKDLPYKRKMTAAYISGMDERIGHLLKKLDDLNLTKNTIIIFQSDQGHSTEVRALGGGGFAGDFRGSKFSLFEGGIRVPAIISWPGKIPSNEVRHQMVANIDWFPTLAEYCELQLPARKIDGKSIRNIIENEHSPSPHPVFFWQCLGTEQEPQWAVREGNWKLLHNPVEAQSGELNSDKLMLINISGDSTEQINQAKAHPEIVKRMKKLYEEWIEEVEQQ